VVSTIAIVLYHLANLAQFHHRVRRHGHRADPPLRRRGVVTAKLAEDGRRLRELAATDDLTGLHNLRSFEAGLAVMVRACARRTHTVDDVVLDVDRLKALNDAYGHLAGAEAVRLLDSTLATCPGGRRHGLSVLAVTIRHRRRQCDEARGRTIAEELSRDHALEPVLDGVAFPVRTLSISVGLACVRDDHVVGTGLLHGRSEDW
jgi:diguanylate cyclase (GGDEF)-like protein